jgi:hypothetical protein
MQEVECYAISDAYACLRSCSSLVADHRLKSRRLEVAVARAVEVVLQVKGELEAPGVQEDWAAKVVVEVLEADLWKTMGQVRTIW